MPYLEVLIFATESPLSLAEMGKLLSVFLNRPITEEAIKPCLEKLVQKYDQVDSVFQIINSGGGYQFLTKAKYHDLISTLNGDKFNRKLSATSMETLAIIAYTQPVTKGEIENIRGVGSDYSIQKLLDKELIYIKGRKEEAIGKPLLYATTPYFMDYLSINDVSELPRLKEIRGMIPVEATEGKKAISENEEN